MPRLGFVTGLQVEARILSGEIERTGVTPAPLVVCHGPGAVRAGQAAQEVLAAGAEALVSFGTAAGLDPALPAGTMVIADAVATASGERIVGDGDWAGRLLTRVGYHVPCRIAPVAAIEAPLLEATAKAALFERSRAAAADMESGAVAAAAAVGNVPFVAVRAILDDARQGLPETAPECLTEDGRIAPLRMARALLRRPGDIVLLAGLIGPDRAARRALSRFARRAFPGFGF